MLPILLFFGLCFFGLGYCYDEPIKEIPIGFLEFEADIVFNDVDSFNSIRGTFGNDDSFYFGSDMVNVDSNQVSTGHYIKHNGETQFFVSYWQIDKEFHNPILDKNWYLIGNTTELKYKVDNWQDDKEFTTVYGLLPVSDSCLNSPTVCFDNQQPLVLMITVFSDNVNIIIDDITKANLRVISAERIDDDSVIIVVDSDGIMPNFVSEYHLLSLLVIFIPFEFVDSEPCFWDNEKRICELELQVSDLEKKLTQQSNSSVEGNKK